jgi:hypothetical protein
MHLLQHTSLNIFITCRMMIIENKVVCHHWRHKHTCFKNGRSECRMQYPRQVIPASFYKQTMKSSCTCVHCETFHKAENNPCFCCCCGPKNQIANDDGEYANICPNCDSQHCLYYAGTNPHSYTTSFHQTRPTSYNFITNHNQPLAATQMSNNDHQHLAAGNDEKIFYATKYSTKDQQTVTSALDAIILVMNRRKNLHAQSLASVANGIPNRSAQSMFRGLIASLSLASTKSYEIGILLLLLLVIIII